MGTCNACCADDRGEIKNVDPNSLGFDDVKLKAPKNLKYKATDVNPDAVAHVSGQIMESGASYTGQVM